MPARLHVTQSIVEVLHGLKQLHLPSCLSHRLQVFQPFLEAHPFNLWFSGSESPHLQVRPARLRVDKVHKLPQYPCVIQVFLLSPGPLSREFIKVCLQEDRVGESSRGGLRRYGQQKTRLPWLRRAGSFAPDISSCRFSATASSLRARGTLGCPSQVAGPVYRAAPDVVIIVGEGPGEINTAYLRGWPLRHT